MGSIGRVVRRWRCFAGMLCVAGLISWCTMAQSASGEAAGGAHGVKTAPAKADGGALSGRVVTPDGKPVKGVPVSWVSRPDREAVVLATVVTDEAGRFVFPDAARLRAKDAYPRFMVEAAGWGLSFRDAPIGDVALEIDLVPPAELRVSFLDEAGKPVPDLLVRPGFFVGGRHSFLDLPRTVADRLGRRTDRDGNVVIKGLPQGHEVRLALADERFATLSYADQIRLDRGPVTRATPIRLRPAASIRGKVIFGPTGKPAAGIRVGAQSVPESNWGEALTAVDGSYELKQLRPGAYDMGTDAGRVTADEQGRYTFAGLWPDLRYSIGATAEGHGENGTRAVQLGPGQSQTLDPIVLRKADRSLAGRVVDGNGDPAPGVRVQVGGNESAVRRIVTDREGRFRVDGLVDEMLSLYVVRAEGLPIHKRVKAGSLDVILVLPGGEQKEARVTREQQERFERLRGQAAPPLNAVAWVNTEPGLARELRGKVVLIDFWSIGCGPCVASLPGVQAAADQLKARGAVVIGLHDSGATREKLREFAKEQKLTFPLAIDAPDEQKITIGKTFRTYGVQGIPSVAVIDRHGNVAYLGHFLTEALARVGALLAQ